MTYTSVTIEGIGETNPFTDEPTCVPVASFTANPTSGAEPLEVEFTDTSSYAESWYWEFGDGNTSTDQHPTHTYEDEGIYEVKLTVANDNGASFVTDTIFVSSGVGVPGSGFLYRPLQSADADISLFEDGIFSNYSDYYFPTEELGWPEYHTVIAASTNPGANVHAAAHGTVQSVEQLALVNDCPGVIGALIDCELTINPGLLNIYSLQLEHRSYYRVQVTFGSGEHLNYYVGEAPSYVYEGLQISAGCVLGKTVEMGGIFQEGAPGWGSGSAFIERINEGADDQVVLIDDLLIEPEDSRPCNVNPLVAGCLPFDPQFRNPSQWTYDSTKVHFAQDGVEIDPYGVLIYSGMPLDENTAYRFSVFVQVVGSLGGISGNGKIQIGLGTSSVSHIVSAGMPTLKSVQLAMHEPDEGSTYTARIANIGTRTLKVEWNCITENADAGPQSQCYFLNYSFDFGLSQWATYGTVVLPPSVGEVMAEDEAAIGQNVYLYPDSDGPHDYLFTLDWAWYVSGGDPTSDAPEVQFEWRFGSDSYDDFGDETTYRALDYSFSERTTEVITVSDNVDEEFRLRVDIDESTFMGTLNILLRELCIQDDFTHHDGGSGVGGIAPIGPDPGMCAEVTRPDISSSINVGAWINYLWLRMRNFFYCNLEPVLQKIARILDDIHELVRWQILYWQASSARLVNWMGYSLVPWLGGHFANMAYGRETTVIQEAEGCNNLFCMLTSLIEEIFAPLIDLIVHYATQLLDLLYRLLNMALDLLGVLASALIRLVVEVINLITMLVNFVRLYLFAFIQSIVNAQPVPMAGLPNCSEDPQSTSWCMAFYGLDKTVFANEGQLIIPIFIAVLAVTQLIWLANKVGDLVDRIGGNL